MDQKQEGDFCSSSLNHRLKIQIGDICCQCVCHSQETYDRLKQLCGNFPSTQQPDITLELKTTERISIGEFESILPEVEIDCDGEYFSTDYSLATGRRNLANGTMTVEAEKHFLNSDSGRGYVNSAVCSVYYTASHLKNNGEITAFIVHSCSIIRHNRALLFAGPSGMGKSTIGRMCGVEHGQVINDEAVMLHRRRNDDEGLMVEGIPIIGELPWRLNTVVPLRAVLLLKQSRRTAVRRLEKMEAYLRFMRQIFSPDFLGQIDRKAVFSMTADISKEVAEAIPFYELEFTLDGVSLWQAVADMEASLEKEGK